jgi:hypothetical protein
MIRNKNYSKLNFKKKIKNKILKMGKKLLVLGFSLSGLLVLVGISGIFLSDNLIKSLVTSVYNI